MMCGGTRSDRIYQNTSLKQGPYMYVYAKCDATKCVALMIPIGHMFKNQLILGEPVYVVNASVTISYDLGSAQNDRTARIEAKRIFVICMFACRRKKVTPAGA
ncbi:unnamed protein product [Nippostrongylus brasiliensis]|uniref:ZP domain-containing protein n=1 Tax=Nippostrongylus brasiliensis TaxID=27835 RepID=A0A0N4Y0Y9_NIPBR|nr:unnamed protein product [Nippostrongylus brasiliensis]